MRINSVILLPRIPNAELLILSNDSHLLNIKRPQTIVLSVADFINGPARVAGLRDRAITTFIIIEV